MTAHCAGTAIKCSSEELIEAESTQFRSVPDSFGWNRNLPRRDLPKTKPGRSWTFFYQFRRRNQNGNSVDHYSIRQQMCLRAVLALRVRSDITLLTAWWNLYRELTTPALIVWADVAGPITWQLLSVSVTNWHTHKHTQTGRYTDRQTEMARV